MKSVVKVTLATLMLPVCGVSYAAPSHCNYQTPMVKNLNLSHRFYAKIAPTTTMATAMNMIMMMNVA